MAETLIGKAAPGFEVPAVSYGSREAARLSLSSFAGEWLLLVFYPRDFSFVCPTELTAFSAQVEAFRSRGCRILGLSVDSIEDHLRWFEAAVEEGGIGPLQFPLGADEGGDVSRRYGVWLDDLQCSGRGLFLIDPAGVLQYGVVHSSSVGRSTEETLRVLDALQSGGLCRASWTSADGTIDAESQLRAGRVLGHYRIVERLGGGAFSTVFAADDLILDRRVAIKVIGRKAEAAREAVLTEARAAAKLQHPNICTMFSVETIDAVPVIVMEYIDGSPLSEMDAGRFNPDDLKSIATGVAAGLAEAHKAGVVHGDLKPANVMITAQGEAKLLDFGLARRSGSSRPAGRDDVPVTAADESGVDVTVIVSSDESGEADRGGSISGTPAYMSPEQTRGLPATTASDVFAFGLVLFELLTGRSAVQGTKIVEVMEQIRSGAVRSAAIEHCPEAFRDLMSRMLADAPEARPTMGMIGEMLDGLSFDAARGGLLR
ncbi:MAG: bifunctional peroxiredoxin/serine/threonine-protein kinase [Planctomycetota bacterium]|nr:MAG: bifunctional peroxiredoxin/serine/threonine-protein kinase [Planctomycetota bacterium]REK35694.1 MAG: bifunctional peroxiredoxin/serine/threonine-protein kinase [Planctomycetota bacterium]